MAMNLDQTVDSITPSTGNLNLVGAIGLSGSYGTSGYVLQTNGSGVIPTWVAQTGGGGGISQPSLYVGLQQFYGGF
jgi:hypothetical protein